MKCTVEKRLFGKCESDQDVFLYTLSSQDMIVKLSEFGAAIISIETKDRFGIMRDVVLGYDSTQEYINDSGYFGATVGRVAGIVTKGRFMLNRDTYQLGLQGKHHYHGGKKGFSKQLWHGEIIQNGVRLMIKSPHMQEGYPGNVCVHIDFQLEEKNRLLISYNAVSDKDTYLNITNHVYFNLNGHNSGTCFNHMLRLRADRFLPVNSEQIPLGEIEAVDGTPMDFLHWKRIGQQVDTDWEQMRWFGGYDHYFIINDGCIQAKVPAVELYSPDSGILLSVSTTKPGMYIYTGNFLTSSIYRGKCGCHYERNSGIVFEPQYFPDGMNHSSFIFPILNAGEVYKHETSFKFNAPAKGDELI